MTASRTRLLYSARGSIPSIRDAEGLATRAAGAVFSDGDFEDEDLLKGDIADGAGVRTLAPSPLATVGARVGLRGAAKRDHANARLNGIHACVLSGLES